MLFIADTSLIVRSVSYRCFGKTEKWYAVDGSTPSTHNNTCYNGGSADYTGGPTKADYTEIYERGPSK